MNKRTLIENAAILASESGENKEYDRALAEFIIMLTGGMSEDVPAILEEIRNAK